MKYIRSTTVKCYVIRGKYIPRVTERKYLELTDSEYITFHKIAVFKSLEESGAIFVTSRNPNKTTASESTTTAVDTAAVKEQVVAEYKEEVEEALAAKDAEIAALKEALAAAQSAEEEE